jgi:hypothetical protein
MKALGTLPWLLVFAWPAAAQNAAPAALHRYPDADLALGARLIREHRCEACHAKKVGGDGTAVYRPAGRVNNPAALLSMVERCNTELSLALFPEEVASVAAVLQRDHYRFAARDSTR